MLRIRVGVMTDSRLLGEGLRRLLSTLPSIVASEVPRAHGPAAGCDVVLADARALPALVRRGEDDARAGAPILALLVDDADDAALAALRHGARGVLARDASREELGRAIRAVRDGQIWAPRPVIAHALDLLAASPVGRTTPQAPQDLSPRERDVARHVGAGLSNREIAGRLSISEATVKAHLSRAFRKLGVRNRAGLVLLQAERRSAPGGGPHRLTAVAPDRPRPRLV
jgi:DNA-binding NarL/FixJ family response regulator